MEALPLPSPIPPAHLRNERHFRTGAVQDSSRHDVGNSSRGHHGKEGRKSDRSHRPNSPRMGYSQSHSQGLSRPSSPSPTRTPLAVPSKTRSPPPMHQLVFAPGINHQQTSPEVIIPRATRFDHSQNIPTAIINRSHSHRPDHLDPIQLERLRDDHHDRPRSQQRNRSTELVTERLPDRSGSRQGFVQRFTTRIPSRSHSRQNRAVIIAPSLYLQRSNKHPFEHPSSECLTGDEVNQTPIKRASAKMQLTIPSDVEDSVSQESGGAVNQDHRRRVADGQIRSVAEQNGRIKALEDELAAIREELERERQRRMSLESQIQVRRMIQTGRADELTGGQPGGIGGGTELAEKHNKRRNEKESKWNEVRSDIKKMQEVLVEVRGRVEKTSIEAESKSTGVETAIEELRGENAQQRELLKSLTEFWRADFSRWQNESISSQEKATLEIQTYLDSLSKALASEVLMLIGEVLAKSTSSIKSRSELGSLLCMKSKYGPGGEFDPEWQLADSSLALHAESPTPPDLPQQSKPSWRSIYPKLGRTKKREVASTT